MRKLTSRQLAVLKRRIYSANYRALRDFGLREQLDLATLLGLLDQAECAYCQRYLTPGTLSLDHVIPLSAGGENAWSNIALACRKCNRYKSAIPAADYRDFLTHLGERWTNFFFSHYRPHGHRRR